LNKYRTAGCVLCFFGIALFAVSTRALSGWFGSSFHATKAAYAIMITSVISAGLGTTLLITGMPFAQAARSWNSIPQWKQLGLSLVIIAVSVAILVQVRRLV